MKASSTEVQNNFGKYLTLAAEEEVIVTRNGVPVAKLVAVKEPEVVRIDAPNSLPESAGPHHFVGRKAAFEEFLELTRDTDDRYEYIDGEIYPLAIPTTTHQLVLGRLLVLFHDWSQGKACEPFHAPFDIRLNRSDDEPNLVQPDLMIICDLEEHLGEDGYYYGVPALMAEIVSDSTRTKDRVKKLDLYLSCGVEEYWYVDPLNREITIYEFIDDDIGNYRTFTDKETARSFVFEGLSAPVEEVFAKYGGASV